MLFRKERSIMLKNKLKILTFLLIAAMFVTFGLNVSAASSNAVTQDGVTAQLFTDKVSINDAECATLEKNDWISIKLVIDN